MTPVGRRARTHFDPATTGRPSTLHLGEHDRELVTAGDTLDAPDDLERPFALELVEDDLDERRDAGSAPTGGSHARGWPPRRGDASRATTSERPLMTFDTVGTDTPACCGDVGDRRVGRDGPRPVGRRERPWPCECTESFGVLCRVMPDCREVVRCTPQTDGIRARCTLTPEPTVRVWFRSETNRANGRNFRACRRNRPWTGRPRPMAWPAARRRRRAPRCPSVGSRMRGGRLVSHPKAYRW